MAEVDASIPLNASGPKPMNPLETLGQVAGVAGQLNQNRLFQQTIQSKQALSQIYQNSIGDDGRIDPAKLTKALQDPSLTLGVPEAVAGAQAYAGNQLKISNDQFDLTQKHLAAMSGRISSLLATQTPLTQKDVISQVGTMIAEGLLKPDEAANELQNLPQDDAGIRTYLTQHLLRYTDMGTRLNAIAPQPTAVNTGQKTNLVQTPQFGSPHVVGQLQNTISPEAAASGVEVIGPDGKKYRVPLASLTPTQLGGTQGPAGLPPAPGQNTGQMPAQAPQGGPQSATGGMPAPAGLPTGAVPISLAPGVGAAADHAAVANADQGLALQRAADAVPTMKATLGNMDGLLDKFTSGPGADWAKAGTAGLNTFLQTLGGDGVHIGPVASQEDFNKQAGMIAQQQFQMLGGTGTDAKLDSAFSTSPNSALSNMGNKEIIGLLKGNADAIAAKNRAWQAFIKDGQHGPQDYGAFSNEFNQTYDPRVFQFQYIPANKRAEIIGKMSDQEKRVFLDAYKVALARGDVKLPKK